MRSPLWSKILGIVIGILLGAGVAYAAVYVYNVSIPSSVSVETETTSQPGLNVSPSPLAFDEIAPGQSTGEKSITLNNVGDKDVNLTCQVSGLASGLTLYTMDVGAGYTYWRTVPADIGGPLAKGSTRTQKFYVKAADTAVTGSYNFTIVIKEK